MLLKFNLSIKAILPYSPFQPALLLLVNNFTKDCFLNSFKKVKDIELITDTL